MFSITISTDNEVFSDNENAEVARILLAVAERVLDGHGEGKCLDANGNTVGKFWLSGSH